jgi:AraC-like DNA-binding protein
MVSLDFAGMAISAFFILFVLSKKKRKKADLLLLLINLTIIGLLLVDALFQRRLTPLVFLLLNSIPLFLLPLFLVFALETLQEHIHHHGRWILLFLPALATTAYIGSDLFIFQHYDQSRLEHLYNHPTLAYHLLCKGFPVVFILAFVWLIKRLRTYAVTIKDSYSFIDPIELSWLTNSTWVYLIITVLSLLGFIASQLQILPISSHTVCTVIGILLFFAIFYVSFHGIHQFTATEYYGDPGARAGDPGARAGDQGARARSAPQNDKSQSNSIHSDPNPAGKYKTSALSDSERKIIFEKVILLFEGKKVYLEPKLQMSDVATALNISPHNLSQTINTIFGRPFYDFVNSYRVRHLQRLLEDPLQQKFTILALGFESGFNSKASLNRVFRQETGLSPTEYLARHQVQQVSAL